MDYHVIWSKSMLEFGIKRNGQARLVNRHSETLMNYPALPLAKVPEIAECFLEESRIVLHCGDSERFLKTIPDETATLIITSPPYNVGKEYETKTSIQAYLKQQDPVIDQLVRILKNEGSICWQVGNFVKDSEVFPLDIFYYDMFKKRQLHLRNRIIWHFGHGLH